MTRIKTTAFDKTGASSAQLPRPLAADVSLRIVIVSHGFGLELSDAELVERDRSLRIGLLEAGYQIVAVLPPDVFLAERVAQLQPDIVIVDARSDARDALEHVVMATRDEPRPIVMFTEDKDPAFARQAIANGVAAYIVAGLSAERVHPIMEVALARFEREQTLRAELLAVKTELKQRPLIEKAKGMLMKQHGIDEAEAYRRMRQFAMDRNLKLIEVAQRLIDAAEMLRAS